MQRSPPSSAIISVNPSAGQTLVLIASDGVRVSVNRAIATEASYVLRDLLDGQDLVSSPVSNADGGVGGFLSEASEASPHLSNTGPSMTVHDLENLFEDPVPSPTAASAGAMRGANPSPPAAVKDLMDFFAPAPPSVNTPNYHHNTSSPPLAHASTSNTAQAAAPAIDAAADDILASLWGPPAASQPASPSAAGATAQHAATPTGTAAAAARSTTSTTHVPSLAPLRPPSPVAPPPPRPPAEVELAFPYFTGDILERVCRHMSYRFRMSSFGTEDGCYRVYMVKTRNIPRPMTLPFIEYLDMKDRRFVADWDEVITVQMVKAATLLNYEELLQLASAKLASYLIDRDLEGVRTFLGVESDFDAVEEAELKKEQATDFNR